jgi:predicted HTH transcriptional regulator
MLGEIRHASNIDALIAAGESEHTEFKSSLHHPYGPPSPDLQRLQAQQAEKEIKKRLQKAITKTIAAFLNTNGGTLLIGVDDSGTVLGIEPDFGYLSKGKQNADEWMLTLKQAIITALGPEVWSAIHASLVRHEQRTVAVVHCPPRASETWLREDGAERFYIRASNATEELTGRSLVKYTREHWPE